MDITTEILDDATIIRFIGAADGTAVAEIRRALGEGVSATSCRVVCDLSGTSYICSDALGAFISAHEEAREAGGHVCLVHPQRRIADILATTQLDRLFEVFESVETALAR